MRLKDPVVADLRPIGVGLSWIWLRRAALLWEHPIGSLVLALVLYSALALQHGAPWRTSAFAYYNYLAAALLQGQLHLTILPRSTHDLSLFQGHYYLYWPPLPAVLLMPFVALFGVQFSDVAFTIGLAALN